MIICSALYYPGSLAKGDLIVRDNRFYPGKYSETFAVWWQYLRKHYPDVPVILFCDTASPIPLRPLLDTLPEPWYDAMSMISHNGSSRDGQVDVLWLSEHSGKYFWPMQRNLVEAIKLAYTLNEDLFWLDSDAFLNTDIRPLIADHDVAAPEIAHHQMTMDSVCTFISAKRLHALDDLGIDLPQLLTDCLANGPTETRMHLFQEGGLYKLFGYGKARSLGGSIELSHLSCYQHFMAFLERNPLDTPEYQKLRYMLASLDMERLKGVELSFHDMYWTKARENEQ